jgi:hypothetical protein
MEKLQKLCHLHPIDYIKTFGGPVRELVDGMIKATAVEQKIGGQFQCRSGSSFLQLAPSNTATIAAAGLGA